MRISNVKCDNLNEAPSSNSLSFRSEASFQSKGSDCRQFSMRARSGCARFKSSLREEDVRTAFKVLEGSQSAGGYNLSKIPKKTGLTKIL
jgi:hypothetical protein